MREAQSMVVVVVVAAIAIVIAVVLQARCIRTVGRVVGQRDELKMAVDQRTDVVGAALCAAGLGPDESLVDAMTRPIVRQAVDAIADLPVTNDALFSAPEDAHMLLVDASNGRCCANAPSRRLSATALMKTPVDLNHLTAEGRKQPVEGSAPGSHPPAPPMLPEIRRKVAAGGGHIAFTAATMSGRRRWHTYYAQVPGLQVYLGAAAAAD